MAKYSKFADADYQVKTFRWPYWLLPLLFLSLLLVLGLFIFITINSADRFGCLFHCEQKIDDGGVVPPKEVSAVVASRRNDQNTTESVLKSESSKDSDKKNSTTLTPGEKRQSKSKNPNKKTTEMMIVKGELIFPTNRAPDSIPPHSHLEVNFDDSSIQDASSVNLGKMVVNLKSYKKGTALTYEIECPKPKNYRGIYSVSAILNMGWIPTNKDEWLRAGDFFTDTMYQVSIKKNVTNYERDIDFVNYDGI